MRIQDEIAEIREMTESSDYIGKYFCKEIRKYTNATAAMMRMLFLMAKY